MVNEGVDDVVAVIVNHWRRRGHLRWFDSGESRAMVGDFSGVIAVNFLHEVDCVHDDVDGAMVAEISILRMILLL